MKIAQITAKINEVSRYRPKIAFVLFFAALPPVHADIGLVAFDTIGLDKREANAGRAGIFLSDICVADQPNQFRACVQSDVDSGTAGIVLRRIKKLSAGSDTQWIALPANRAFYGKASPDDAPILENGNTLRLMRKENYEKPRRPLSGKFDRDWSIFIQLAKKSGLPVDAREETALKACVAENQSRIVNCPSDTSDNLGQMVSSQILPSVEVLDTP